MQRLSRALLSQLVRSSPQAALHSSTAAGPTTAAAAAAAGASLFSIRWFSSSEGSQRLYIGNLSFDATQEDLMAAFEKYGPVHVSPAPQQQHHANLLPCRYVSPPCTFLRGIPRRLNLLCTRTAAHAWQEQQEGPFFQPPLTSQQYCHSLPLLLGSHTGHDPAS